MHTEQALTVVVLGLREHQDSSAEENTRSVGISQIRTPTKRVFSFVLESKDEE
jgi:hypothetical protein